MAKAEWLIRMEGDRVVINADHPDAHRYYQDTDEVRLSDSGCPGAGDGLGPLQVLYNRSKRADAQKDHNGYSSLNPSSHDEIWE